MARSGGRHIVRNILIGLGAFVVFVIVISEIVTHTGGSSKAPAASTGGASTQPATVASLCTAIVADDNKPGDHGDNPTEAKYVDIAAGGSLLQLVTVAGPNSPIGEDAQAAIAQGKGSDSIGIRESPQWATVLNDCYPLAGN